MPFACAVVLGLSCAACVVSTTPIVATSGGDAPPAASTPPAPSGPGIAAGGAVQNAPADAKLLACVQQARQVQGNTGTSWYVRCPAGCSGGATVWGTDVYTDDSSVCVASVHAGRIDPTVGGIVLVTWVAGPPIHAGSLRNGVHSSDYGPWARSFFVQSIDPAGRPTSPPPASVAGGPVPISCGTQATSIAGASMRVSCPGGCSGGSIWGTDVYTADSHVCRAAIHAGVIAEATGGEVTVTMGGPMTAFTGTTRNGVTTAGYGAYEKTFRVSR
jgi:hypothetical protein